MTFLPLRKIAEPGTRALATEWLASLSATLADPNADRVALCRENLTALYYPEYVGNWTAAGITKVRLWLNDVNVADPLEMHFSLGRAPAFPDAGNFWQYNVGFIPPSGQWNEFEITLKGDRLTVVLNGKTVIENAESREALSLTRENVVKLYNLA